MLEIVATLVRDPFCLKPDDIRGLNRWWIAHVYFHPTDKFGAVKVRKKQPQTTWERHQKPRTEFDVYRDWALTWGWPEWWIKVRWEQDQARRKTTKRRKRCGTPSNRPG